MLAVAPVVAPVVTAASFASTSATTTASSIVSATARLLLLSSSFLRLFLHLARNLVLGLNRGVVLFELGPAELLVLEHVLDELLDTLADSAGAWLGCLRLLPDLVKPGQNAVVLLLAELAGCALAALLLLAQLLFDLDADLLEELDGRLNRVFEEELRVEQVLKDRLCSVSAEQVLNEELTDELDVAEQLVLALQHFFLMVVLRVRFASFVLLGLERLEVALLLKDFFEAAAAIVEELLAEHAVLEVELVALFALRLEVDLDDRRTDLLAVELRVFVLHLGLAENRLHDDSQDLIINLEVFGLLGVKAFLT